MDPRKPPAEKEEPGNTPSAVFDVGPHVKEDTHWPLSAGETFQDPEWMSEPTDSTKPCIQDVP